jgi:NADH-quinone oxidoreductase subunit M
MLQRIFMGPENEKWKLLPDISVREIFTVAPLMILMLAIGIWPRLLVDIMNPAIVKLVDYVASLAGGM